MAHTPSIRLRLLCGMLIGLVAILGTTAGWSYLVTQREAEELFSARLATSARVLDAIVARSLEHATMARPIVIALPEELEHAAAPQGSALGHPYETKIAFQVWHEDGTLLARSKSAPARAFSANVPGFSTPTVDGEPYHVFVLHSGATWIQVAEKTEVRQELIGDLGAAVMTPLVIGAALLLVAANLLVVYGLAPLRQLASDIGKREPDVLDAIELDTVPREIAPVVKALNDLLARVRLAFERERRFTDAAAHELRTPIAALKVHADNVARARTEAERASSMTKLRQGLARTSNLAAQLLSYSRTQNAAEHEPRVRVRLSDVVRETGAALEAARQAKSQQIVLADSPATADACIVGEPGKIQRLVLNLLDNAVRYAPQGSRIDVGLAAERGRVVLAVANRGAAIPPALRERVFEPYYRVPGASSEGSGLGLAIVKEIAAQHGASVALSAMEDGEGTVVSVSFPAAPASRPNGQRPVVTPS